MRRRGDAGGDGGVLDRRRARSRRPRRLARQIGAGGEGGVDLHVRVGKDAVIEAALPEGVSAEKPVAAFCGIADPEKFKDTLKQCEVYPDWFRGFGDHHMFSSADLKELRDLSKSHQMITTQKDWVRLPEDLQALVMSLSYGVRLVAPEKLWSQLKPILRS